MLMRHLPDAAIKHLLKALALIVVTLTAVLSIKTNNGTAEPIYYNLRCSSNSDSTMKL